MSKLGILASASILFSAAAAHADIAAVHGTAKGFEIDPTTDLALLGFAVDPAGSFEFWYSYDTSGNDASPGSFKLVSYNAAGAPIDSVDLGSTTIYFHAVNDVGSGSSAGNPVDEYTAGAQSSRNGVGFQVLVDLIDRHGATLPASPATYLNETWPDGMWIGIGVANNCQGGLCEGFVANITSLSATLTPVIVDADGDGIPDSLDKCAGSSSGPVNADGCTPDQLVPCAGPKGGGSWKNHGQYLSNLAKVLQAFVDAGLITEDQKDALMSGAAGTTCGK
jgi:hypothetical protein